MNRIPLLYTLVGAIFIAFIMSWLSSSTNPEQNQENDMSIESDYFIQKVTIKSFDKDGLLENSLNAKKLEHFKNNQISIISDATIEMKSKNQSFWSIHATNGHLDHNNNQVKLTESVKIMQLNKSQPLEQNDESLTLSSQETGFDTLIETQDLNYDLTNNIAATENNVLILNNNMTTTANSMTIDLNIEKVTLNGQAQTTGELNE